MSYRIYVLITVVGLCYLQSIAYSKEQVKQYPNPDYVEILFGSEDVPLVALGRDVLSSDDVQTCSRTNINQVNTFQPIVALNQAGEQLIKQPTKQQLENLLLGFPLKALNKLMAMGAVLIDFSDNNNLHFQTPSVQQMIGQYRLSRSPTIEVRPKVIASSDNKGCVLNFIYCPERLKCFQKSVIFHASVLGVSVKHQALIVDPNEFGIHLEDEIRELIRPSTSPSSLLKLNLEDHRSHVIAFGESALVFDVVGKFRRPDFNPHLDVTTRWFLKFNLVESEEGFQSRPSTEGIKYALNTSRYLSEQLYVPMRIVRQRIFKDGKIKPIRYYVKNVPSRFQESVRRGFEYWRSFFVSLLGHPILSYYFIQGDFDGGQEIIAGDIRFNVLEWHFSKQAHLAISRNIFNRYTGEIWSSSTILPGAQLIGLYQEWFKYSQFVRDSMSAPIPELTHSNDLLKNLFRKSFQAPYSEDNSSYSNILLPLFPSEETFNSYMLGLIENLTAHEIGHGLGLGHNHKANLFAKGIYAGNSQMDYFALQDKHKPISGEYDKMALAYGYLGVLPKRTDMLCDLADRSPECRMHDQGSHPLENAGIQLQQIVRLLSSRSHPRAYPYLRWNIQAQAYVKQSLNLILPFYYLAETHYDRLQTVLIDGRKPENPQEVKDLVQKMLSDIFCDPELNDILNLREPYQRSNPYDRQLQRNVTSLFEEFRANIQPYIKDFQC